MKKIDEYKKAAKEVEELFKMADELRKAADQIEAKASEVENQAPAVFIEDAGRNNNTLLYISTGSVVAGKAQIEQVGKWDAFLVMELDPYAMEDLRKALKKGKKS